MAKTKIEWCDYTINPVVGCHKCSPGCKNCYAERTANRLAKIPQTAKNYAGIVDKNGQWTGYVSGPDYSVFDRLPKKPARVFVGSMTDLFYFAKNDRPDEFIDMTDASTGEKGVIEWAYNSRNCRLVNCLVSFGKMPQHTFMFLTKRPNEMAKWMPVFLKRPLKNLWLGVTICNQQEAGYKLAELSGTPAALRFVSIEPMLGPIDISGRLDGIGWVICGGETGPGKRPFDPQWALDIQAQCEKAGVPFFYKLNGYGGLDGRLRQEFPERKGDTA